MPIITMWAWTSLDLLSAWLRLVRRSSSKPETPRESEPAGQHVDLEVELRQLGLEERVGDRLQRLGALQRGPAVVVDEVELDLHARSSGSRCRTGTHAASARRRRGSGVPSRGSGVRSERVNSCRSTSSPMTRTLVVGNSALRGAIAAPVQWDHLSEDRQVVLLELLPDRRAEPRGSAPRRRSAPSSSPGRPRGTGRSRTRRGRRHRAARPRTPAARPVRAAGRAGCDAPALARARRARAELARVISAHATSRVGTREASTSSRPASRGVELLPVVDARPGSGAAATAPRSAGTRCAASFAEPATRSAKRVAASATSTASSSSVPTSESASSSRSRCTTWPSKTRWAVNGCVSSSVRRAR